MPDPAIAEEIAHLALDTFDNLPKKCKPRVQPDGRREWTPMSAVIVSRPRTTLASPGAESDIEHDLTIVSLATGTKSLPVSALPKCDGLVLHDSHAEILAFRGFNYWVLCEMERMLVVGGYASPWLELIGPSERNVNLECAYAEELPPFEFRQGVEISLFATEAPCGDASMELLMEAAEAAGEDVSPWAFTPTAAHAHGSAPKAKPNSKSIELPGGIRLPPGRGYFSNLGALRRKPARADAEISMSKSCTDKLMLKQVTGLLSYPLDLFIGRTDAAYLQRMVIYQDQYNQEGYGRAFAAQGRLQRVFQLPDELKSKHRFFEVEVVPEGFRRFEFEKAVGGSGHRTQEKWKPSSFSALWVAGSDGKDDVVEALVNGVKQGYKQFDHREGKASVVCRRKMLGKATKMDQLLQEKGMRRSLPESLPPTARYSDSKLTPERRQRRYLKQYILDGLGGWPGKVSDDDFLVAFKPLSIDDNYPLCFSSCSSTFRI